MAKRGWKNTASIILTAKRGANEVSRRPVAIYNRNILPEKLKKDDFNFRILCLKRGEESKFMPNTYVFPGGLLDKADLSTDWSSIFRKLDENFLDRFVISANKPKSFKFTSIEANEAGTPKSTTSTLPLEIATRICAIRETFEESGVLLARKTLPEKQILPFSASFSDDSLPAWREKVSADGKAFLLLCKEKNICPDIWALHEWANWLTPTTFSRRFNTIFYTCFLNVIPNVAVDNQEMAHAQWFSPTEAMDHFYANKVMLPPPQNYEIRRMGQIVSIEKLATFSKNRAFEGVECFFPIIIPTKDGLLHVLPGDSIYPAEPDIFGDNPPLSSDKTMIELRNEATYLNRGEGHDLSYKYYCNVTPACGHLPPVCDDNGDQSSCIKSRL